MGGALLQQINRDTLQVCAKVFRHDRDGQWHNVYKNPKTDPVKSQQGRPLNLIQDGKDLPPSNC